MDINKIEKILQSESEKKQLVLMYNVSKTSNASPSNEDVEEMQTIINSMNAFNSWTYPTIEETERLKSLLSAKSISWIKFFLEEKKLLSAMNYALSNKEKSRSGKDITVLGNLLRSFYFLFSISVLKCKVSPDDVINLQIMKSIYNSFIYVQSLNVKTLCMENFSIAATTNIGHQYNFFFYYFYFYFYFIFIFIYFYFITDFLLIFFSCLRTLINADFVKKYVTMLMTCEDEILLLNSLDFATKFIFIPKHAKMREQWRLKFFKCGMGKALQHLKETKGETIKNKVNEFQFLCEKDTPKSIQNETSAQKPEEKKEISEKYQTEKNFDNKLNEENLKLQEEIMSLSNQLKEQLRINQDLSQKIILEKKNPVIELYEEVLQFNENFKSDKNVNFSESEKKKLSDLIESKLQLTKQVGNLINEKIKLENDLNEMDQNLKFVQMERNNLRSENERLKEKYENKMSVLQKRYSLLENSVQKKENNENNENKEKQEKGLLQIQESLNNDSNIKISSPSVNTSIGFHKLFENSGSNVSFENQFLSSLKNNENSDQIVVNGPNENNFTDDSSLPIPPPPPPGMGKILFFYIYFYFYFYFYFYLCFLFIF